MPQGSSSAVLGLVVVALIKEVTISLGHVSDYLDDVIAFDPDPASYLRSQHQGALQHLWQFSRECPPPRRLKYAPQRDLIPAGLFVKTLGLFFLGHFVAYLYASGSDQPPPSKNEK